MTGPEPRARVYLPFTLPGVAALIRAGSAEPPPGRGYAVTPALRGWLPGGDEEELEYAALSHAARHSLQLLAADPAAPRRRVVLAAEIAAGQLTPAGDPGEPALVIVSGPVRLADIRSGHVDDAADAEVIGAAAAALAGAESGDAESGNAESGDTTAAVEAAGDIELSWYATQELAGLAAGGG